MADLKMMTSPNCSSRLAYEDVRAFADSNTFQKYDDQTFQAFLSETMAHLQTCRHAGCGFKQQCSPEKDSFIICQQRCERRTCIACDAIWHTHITCAEASADREGKPTQGVSTTADRAKEVLAGEKYIAENAKRCPSCDAVGEKIDGCDHITCESLRTPQDLQEPPQLLTCACKRPSLPVSILLALPSRLRRDHTPGQRRPSGHLPVSF